MRYLYLPLISVVLIAMVAFAVCAQDTAPKVIRGGILNGKAVSLPKPEYPETARSAGVEGAVRVDVMIDESGTVVSAKAIREEEPDNDLGVATVDAKAELREAAERAALAARFSPTLLSGTPVKVSGTITYRFSLKTDPDEASGLPYGGVINGRAIELPRPDYPAAARAVRASGTVTVKVTVDENGDVIAASAVSGHPLLQAAAVDAARKARFSPAADRMPIKFTGVITYNFVLPVKEN